MYRIRLFKTLLSLITVVAILLGSSGFVILKHECRYSGSEVYIYTGDNKPESACCNHDDNTCCEAEVCERYNNDSCCENKIEVLQLPGFTISDKTTEKEFSLISESLQFTTVPEIKRTDLFVHRSYQVKHRGKDILIFHCQSLT